MAGEWEYEIVVHQASFDDENPSYNQAMIARRRPPGLMRGRVGEPVTPWEEFCWCDRRGAQEVIKRLRLAEITPEKIQSPADVNLMKENERLVNEVATRDQELREMQALMNDTNARFAAVEGKVAEIIGKNGEFEVERIGYERRIEVLAEQLAACVTLLTPNKTVPDFDHIAEIVNRRFNAEWKAKNRG